MLTECPFCQTRYELEDSLFRRRGRRIRCASCQENWYQLPPDSRPASDAIPTKVTAPLSTDRSIIPVALTDNSIIRRRAPISAHTPKAASSSLRRPALKLVGIAGCLSALMLMIAQRDRIVRILPRSGPIYASIGLPVNLRGLEFRDIKSTILSDNGQRMLAVEGVIAQVGKKNAAVPDVRVAVWDPSGRELYSWTAPAPKQKLNLGETTAFRARLAAPPVTGAQVRVQFADAATP